MQYYYYRVLFYLINNEVHELILGYNNGKQENSPTD